MTTMLNSVTAVVIIRREIVSVEIINQLIERLASYFRDIEIVLIANGVAPEKIGELKRAAEKIPDCTLVFLNDEEPDDIARLLGVDFAISDNVLFCTPRASEITALPDMLAVMEKGHDVVIGEADQGGATERMAGQALLFWIFRTLYRLLSGRIYEVNSPRFRLFGRAAALYVASRSDGEVLIRAKSLGRGFSVATIDVPAEPGMTRGGGSARKRISRGLRLLLTGSTMPLRVASYLGLFGGSMSLLYAAYAVLIYFFKVDVAPGWTTLSLQSAGMMFLFSIQFVFLSEYLIQILSSAPAASRRQLVAREIRGSLSRRSTRLNLVDAEGRYQVGAPAALLSGKDPP